jgi:two-component system NtrC family sensor kinase
MNRPFGERILSDDLPAVRQLFDDLVAGRQAFGTAEFRVHHTSGSVRTVRANATPIHEPSGKISGVVVAARDMTEFKKLEQQVWQAEKLAAMGQMIAGVAHELNNPLTVILGASDLSATKAPDEATRRNFELIQQQAWRTARIVQDLLAFSRPPKPERSRLDMNDLIQRTLKLQEYSLRQARIRTDFLPATVPPAVFGDDHQIVQVLLSLITNAEQAMSGVRQGGTLRIRTGTQNAQVWVTVEDDGPGLGPEIAPHIFDPFFTTKRPGKNTGLGLSISLSLVREHGGTLTGQNAPAGGALFTLTLPTAPEEAVPEPAAPADIDLRGRSALIVDDETGILDLVRLALNRRGMHVDCASNGKEALDKLQMGSYDCVLCDLKMPGITGRDVYQGYRQRHPDAAKVFIVMSGELMQQETQTFLKETQVPLLQKPFTLAELGEILGRELHKAGNPGA